MVETVPSVRVGVIGSGYMARAHVRAFAGLGSIVGIVGRDIQRAKDFGEEFNIPFATNNIHDLFRKCMPDLLVIAVPELELPRVLESCLGYPAKILAEKPIGIDLKTSVALTHRVIDHAIEAYVALNRRHYSSTLAVLEQLTTQEEHKRLIQVLDQEDQVAALYAGQPHEVVRNWMFANSIHVVDLIRLFGRGEITSVEVNHAWNSQEPWFVSGVVKFASGDETDYQAVWNAPGPWSFAVTTPTTRYEMRPLEQLWLQENGSRSLVGVPPDPVDQQYKPGLRRQAENAIRAVTGAEHRLPTFQDALESMRLVAALYSLEEG